MLSKVIQLFKSTTVCSVVFVQRIIYSQQIFIAVNKWFSEQNKLKVLHLWMDTFCWIMDRSDTAEEILLM